MALSDPFMGSALYDPFSLFLGTPIGGGGQVSSSRGVLEQRLRPIHLDVKGCPFLFFLFLCFFPFCSFPSRSIQVSLKGKELAGKRGRMEADFAEKAKQRRRRSRFVVAASHRRVVVAGNACIQTRTLSSTTLLILSSPPPPQFTKKTQRPTRRSRFSPTSPASRTPASTSPSTATSSRSRSPRSTRRRGPAGALLPLGALGELPVALSAPPSLGQDGRAQGRL